MTTPNFQQVSWRSWLLWTGACALAPAANQILITAAFKTVRPTDPFAHFIKPGVIAIIIASLIIPRIVETAALRMIVPRLSFFCWAPTTLLALFAYFAVTGMLGGQFGGYTSNWFATPEWMVISQSSRTAPFQPLTWLFWFGGLAAQTATIVLIPSLLLGMLSKAGTWRFLVAAFTGALFASCTEIFLISPLGWPPMGLNGMAWPQRLEALAQIGAKGAVWGATSGLALMLLTRKPTPDASQYALTKSRGLTLAVALTALLIVTSMLSNPFRVRNLFYRAQNFFSAGLHGDQPTGEKTQTVRTTQNASQSKNWPRPALTSLS